ncbi:MAG: hypothetical protein WA700_14015 [Acidobacteriaceae bacterium]
MNKRAVETHGWCFFVMAVVLSAVLPARAQDRTTSYRSMAPVEQYLMADRNAEIALARSAAPASISRDATVMVLGRHGYTTAVEGKNGFVCVVERGWMSPFDARQFWNPKMRGPICFNPPAARCILPLTLKRTELVLSGLTKDQVMEGVRAALNAKELPTLEPGAMSYMMSKQGYLGDGIGHWRSHLMFYVPLMKPANWGADLPGSPVLLNPQFRGAPEPITEFMVPVLEWSDGTPAEHM